MASINVTVRGINYHIFSDDYVPNKNTTESEHFESLLKYLKHGWEVYCDGCRMLTRMYSSANGAISLGESIRTQEALRDAFTLRLMRYILTINPKWMEGVAYVDFSQSNGVLDVWKYDRFGNLLSEDPFTIINW